MPDGPGTGASTANINICQIPLTSDVQRSFLRPLGVPFSAFHTYNLSTIRCPDNADLSSGYPQSQITPATMIPEVLFSTTPPTHYRRVSTTKSRDTHAFLLGLYKNSPGQRAVFCLFQSVHALQRLRRASGASAVPSCAATNVSLFFSPVRPQSTTNITCYVRQDCCSEETLLQNLTRESYEDDAACLPT